MRVASHDNDRHWRAKSRLGSWVCDKWRLTHLLGVGGVAAVYRATHRNGKCVALKILHPEHAHLDEVKERFLEEGYAANKVAHTGVASVLDEGVTTDGCVFLVMDLLEGETLEQRLNRCGGVLPADEVLSIAEEVLSVLVAAHKNGIIHRDIKPENVFITYAGEVKLLDFGIARVDQSRRARVTEVGYAMGTPAFMPPEQACGRTWLIDGRADVWALGATMYRLLTGQLVREADTPNEELLLAMIWSAPELRGRADVDPAVAELVDRALSFQIEDRWESAEAMLAALRDVKDALDRTRGSSSFGGVSVPVSRQSEPPTWPLALRHRSSAASASDIASDSTPTTRRRIERRQRSGRPGRRTRILGVGLSLVAGVSLASVRAGNDAKTGAKQEASPSVALAVAPAATGLAPTRAHPAATRADSLAVVPVDSLDVETTDGSPPDGGAPSPKVSLTQPKPAPRTTSPQRPRRSPSRSVIASNDWARAFDVPLSTWGAPPTDPLSQRK